MNILAPGHPARKKLDAIQSDIARLRGEVETIKKQPLSLDDQKALLLAAVDRKRSQSNPDAQLRRFHNLRADGSMPQLHADIDAWDIAFLFFDREEIAARLTKRLEQTNEGKTLGLPRAEREAKLAELQKEISLLENREELEILRLEEDRWTVIRRGDADARLLLEIWLAHRPEAVPTVAAGPVGISKLPHINTIE